MRWPWKPGRQGGNYWKLKLLSWEPHFDLYLLYYPHWSFIAPHRDPVPGRRHYRANLLLREARNGGRFWRHGPALFQWRGLVVFRPDVVEHGVERIRDGSRLVLSLGGTLKEKPNV